MSGSTGSEVFLHVGTMKSGTSYVQALMRRNDAALADAGVLEMTRIMSAMQELRGRDGKTWPREFKGAWNRMMTTVDAWPGKSVLLSQEFLAAAPLAEAERVIGGLRDHGHEVSVIITARDLLRNIPSHWQTNVRSGSTVSFAEFVAAVLDPPDAADAKKRDAKKMSTTFWRAHDLARVTRNWATAVGPGQPYVDHPSTGRRSARSAVEPVLLCRRARPRHL